MKTGVSFSRAKSTVDYQKQHYRTCLNSLVGSLLLAFFASILTPGCGVFGRPVIVVTATASPEPTQIVSPTLLPTTVPDKNSSENTLLTNTPTEPPTAVPAANAIKLWRSPEVPPEYQEALSQLVATGRYIWADEGAAQVKLVTGQPSDKFSGEWVYVPVAAFPTVTDDIKWSAVQAYWRGDANALVSISGNGQSPVFVTTPEIRAYMMQRLGTPAPNVKFEVVPPDAIVTTLWLRKPAAWAVIPFQRLDSAMKALTIDGMSVFDRGLDLSKYPLVQPFVFQGDAASVEVVRRDIRTANKWVDTNRDLSKMTILVMTGVTALARATAYQMEQTGITLPARDILPFLQDADFVHTSNEVAFAKDCPNPNPAYTDTNLRFCSKESYFDLLKTARVNIVELTGNHVNDWGTDALANTINLYNANNMKYFGGGVNDEDAKKALIINHNGNTIALIGCNPAGPQPAWATATDPGSAKCDDGFIGAEIGRLKALGDTVIMSLQYEEYYQYEPMPDQVVFFQKYATFGADLVMGSQAHVPQGFAFTNNTFIHYGYGNLFFDQMDALNTRQLFADKLIIYNSKHISTVLFTGIIEDYSRPRPMTSDERAAFLQTMFKASGW